MNNQDKLYFYIWSEVLEEEGKSPAEIREIKKIIKRYISRKDNFFKQLEEDLKQ